MWGEILKKGKRSSKFILSWVFSALAIVLVFVGVGILPGVVQSWNDGINGGNDDWTVLGEDDYYNNTASATNLTKFTLRMESPQWTNDVYVDQVSNTLLNTSENGYSIIIANPEYTYYNGITFTYQSILFVTNYKISELINLEKYNWRLKVNSTWNCDISIFVTGATDGKYIDKQTSMWTKTAKSIDSEVSLDLLDLLYAKTLNGNGYLGFAISKNIEEGQRPIEFFVETFQFQFMYEDIDNILVINPMTTWKILAGVEAVIFFGMGLASSPFWNPTDKYNPGPVDKMLGGLMNRVTKKRRK
jgi:hypothetical protein